MSNYIITAIIGGTFLYGLYKKAPLYDYFVEGAKGVIPLVISIFPYIAIMSLTVEMLNACGISLLLESFFSPLLNIFGIPDGLFQLIFFRPFTGSGSITILQNIFDKYGVDSYEGKCASIICGSSETIFYLSAIYFSAQGIKKLRGAIVISCISTFVGIVIACFLARFI